MALIDHITHQSLQTFSRHTKADCTFDVITEVDGTKYLQLDTYGSKERAILGKKSQSIRLSPSALQELKRIIHVHQL